MPPARGRPPLPLLRLIYTRTDNLGAFIASLVDERDRALFVTEADPPAYKELLRRTAVALDDDYKAPSQPWRLPNAVEATGMKEAVDFAMLAIFERAAPAQPSNQLTMGFTSSEWSYQAAVNEPPVFNAARPGIHAKHPNSTHTVFGSAAWRMLLARIGTGPLVHLLARTSVFVSLDNGCLLQVAGRPVVDIKPSKSASGSSKRKGDTETNKAGSGSDQDVTPPARKRRKGRNLQQRKRKVVAPEPSTEPAAAVDGDEPMDWDSFDYSFAFSPGVDDADIEAELNSRAYRPPKRARTSTDERPVSVTPADITVPRNRIFYAKPMVRRARLPSQKRIVCGLPEDHIFNVRPVANATMPKTPDAKSEPPPHPLALLMHIFPRQFGLDNVFTTTPPAFVSTGSINYGHMPTRTTEIESRRTGPGGLKIDKKSRMRSSALQAAMDGIRSRWQAEDVWKLRAICCPSKTKPVKAASDGAPAPEVSLPVEFVTQPPATGGPAQPQPATQASAPEICTQKSVSTVRLDDPPSTLLPHGEEEALAAASSKAQRFASYTQPIGQVTRFISGVVKRVFTLDVLGSAHNQNLVLHHVTVFLRQRRHETCTLHSLLQGFKVMDCAWLAPAGFVPGARVTEGDARKRRELLAEFLWWLFDGFLIPLLKTNFYVTESAAYKKEVLFFRQDDWDVLSRPVLKQLQATVYKEVPDFEANKVVGGGYRQLGHSQVRLLPKETGVRPIINLRRKPRAVEGVPNNAEKSINARLKETFSVLVHHKTTEPEIFGSSILSADDIYPRLRAFYGRARLPDGTLPQLYFAKVDVRSCFDTIEQSTLMDVLSDLLDEDEDYQIVGFNKAKLTGGQVKKRFLNQAFPFGTTPSFPDQAVAMSRDHSKEVLMDKAHSTFISRDQVAALLREHIQSNTIKIGSAFYRQAKGIPQGSVVSTYLCSLFYADMERKHLAFTQASDSMLVRLVDDFLLVTTDRAKAVHFVRTMHAGHPKYGCYVAPEKTLLSGFECAVLNQATPKVLIGDRFPWCGRLIDTRTLAMMGDYSRDTGNVKNTLTVDVRRQPGLSLRSKILRNVALKSSIAFNDTGLNSRSVVYANVYQNVAHGAMKAVHLAAALCFDAKLHASHLLRIIDEVGDFAYATVVSGAKTKAARAAGAEVAVDKAVICWLSKHAFHRILAAKQTKFAPVVKSLRTALEQGPNPCAGAGLEGWETLVERAWEGVKGVAY